MLKKVMVILAITSFPNAFYSVVKTWVYTMDCGVY